LYSRVGPFFASSKEPSPPPAASSRSWLKADHPMAYADTFAAATAVAHDATLVTGDPELLIDDAPWRWEDLRAGVP
jgi:hypothetical protein